MTTLHPMHRKRLFHQEFGTDNPEDAECFRESKRFLSEELSLQIQALKLNNNNPSITIPKTNNNLIQIPNDTKNPVQDYNMNLNSTPKPNKCPSPTNLSRAYKANKQKALMVYQPPTITTTNTEGMTKTISSPQRFRSESYPKLTSPTFVIDNIFLPHKPTQYVEPEYTNEFSQLVLYKDPKELMKEAYDKVNIKVNSPMDYELIPGVDKPFVETIELDTDSMQDDDEQMS
jgi:hypothetical protein